MKHLEDSLQIACVQYFRLKYPKRIILAIPNGGSRNVIEALKLKRMGVLAGVSDLFIPEPVGQYHGYWVELKVQKNKPTKLQQQFLDCMQQRQYCHSVIRSVDEFMEYVDAYFKREEETFQ